MLYKEEQSSGVAVSKKASQEMLYMSLYVRDHNSREGGGKIKKKKKKRIVEKKERNAGVMSLVDDQIRSVAQSKGAQLEKQIFHSWTEVHLYKEDVMAIYFLTWREGK